MDDLEGTLNRVLSDPDSMEKIFSIAKSLGVQPPTEAPNTEHSVTPDASALSAMTRMLSSATQGDGRQAALLNALKPFLRPERRKSLDRAIQAAKISHLARFALENLGDTK